MVEEIILTNKVTKSSLLLTQERYLQEEYILINVDWGVVEGTHYKYKYVNQIGTSVTNTALGTREISIIGYIIATSPTDMSLKKSFLNKFINPQQEMILTYKEYQLNFLPDSTIKYGVNEKENNEIMCKFKIDGLCYDPLFREKDERKVIAASTTSLFHFPLIVSNNPNPPGGIIFGLRQPSLIVNVVNSGSVEVGLKIVFKAKGTLDNPKLVNMSTQEFFKINKTMFDGEEIVVDTTIGQKSVKGIFGDAQENYFKYRDLESTWLQLSPGDNLFRYDADTNIGSLEVYIYYNNKFLEVQQ